MNKLSERLRDENTKLRGWIKDAEGAADRLEKERDKYKAEAELWQKAAGEQMVRAERFEAAFAREQERIAKNNKRIADIRRMQDE